MKKGQAALEFLMTYGWAFLVILVMIAALAYFGVLSPKNLIGERCTAPSGFTCEEFVVESNQVQFVLRNNLGETIDINPSRNGAEVTIRDLNVAETGVTVAGIDGGDITNIVSGGDVGLEVGTFAEIPSGEKYSIEVRVPYQPVGGQIEKNVVVTLFGEVQ